MDKYDRLLDAIEHPDRYSDRDIEAMLQDPEIKDAYGLFDKAKSSLTPVNVPDVEAEWRAFESARRRDVKPRLHILNLFSRNVAAGIAIAAGSLVAVGAVVGLSVNYVMNHHAGAPVSEPEPVSVPAGIVTTTDTVTVVDEVAVSAPETVVFDNEQLESVIEHIAEYYGYKVIFSDEAPRSLRLYYRWNRTLPVDEVVESLNNFEQIHITVKGNTIKID